jgi:hypothetical protein
LLKIRVFVRGNVYVAFPYSEYRAKGLRIWVSADRAHDRKKSRDKKHVVVFESNTTGHRCDPWGSTALGTWNRCGVCKDVRTIGIRVRMIRELYTSFVSQLFLGMEMS